MPAVKWRASAMDTNETGEITRLLSKLREGDRSVEDRLFGLLYQDLRRLAHYFLAAEREDHTLQPTALVNEVYLKLAGAEVNWHDRHHFIAVAARAMRRVLVDHARNVKAQKRDAETVPLDGAFVYSEARSGELLALDDALNRLATWDARQAQLVELRFFGGLTLDEIATILKISTRTAKRDWNMARSWLFGELRGSRDHANGSS
jgi:RNA polymerase sigma factor (TIGR02999 family)